MGKLVYLTNDCRFRGSTRSQENEAKKKKRTRNDRHGRMMLLEYRVCGSTDSSAGRTES